MKKLALLIIGFVIVLCLGVVSVYRSRDESGLGKGTPGVTVVDRSPLGSTTLNVTDNTPPGMGLADTIESIDAEAWAKEFASEENLQKVLNRDNTTAKLTAMKVGEGAFDSEVLEIELQNIRTDYLEALDDPELRKTEIDLEALATIQSELKSLFKNLDQTLEQVERKKIEDCSLAMVGEFHLGLGLHRRNQYGLWSGKTQLGKAFHYVGITNADDSSQIVLNEYWRYVHQVPS